MAINPAKKASMDEGQGFLSSAFSAEERVLALEISLSSSSVTHSGVAGTVNEQHFIGLLRRYLPKRYEVDSAIVIDSNGRTSDQIDVVIFDNQYTPTLLDQKSHRFVPAEAVYAVLEVKPTIDKDYVEYAVGKAASVRALHRTSIPIRHAGGEYPAKELFPIVSGLVAPAISWKDSFEANAFRELLATLSGDRALNCALGLVSGAFDTFSGQVVINSGENSLIYFIFRLLQQLQSMGTVPAVDWNRYASILSANRA
ncbi:MAG: hypothetical protein LAT61_09115 [Alcanivorax sp.]|nr:hypothetical protein [Alcanivorax sp.]